MTTQHPPPQPFQTPPPDLERPKKGCPVWMGNGTRPERFWLLGTKLSWYGVHCRDSRPTPCLRTLGRCRPCDDGWLPRPVAYISAFRPTSGGRYLLRISEYAYRHCPLLAAVFNLRGSMVEVKRLAERKNAAWWVQFVPNAGPPPTLPPAVNLTVILSSLWGVDLRRVAEQPPADGDITPALQPFGSKRGGAT